MFGVTLIDNDDNRVDLTIGTRDVLKFERNGGDLSRLTNDDVPLVDRLTETYKLAHLAAVRTKKFTGTLAKFEDTYDIELESDDEENLPSHQEA